MKKMYLISAILLFTGQSCKYKETLTPEEVTSAVKRFDNGWRYKNAKAVDSVLSPSYIYFTQSGGIFKRANVMQTAASSDYQIETLQREQLDIKIEGNTAIVNTIWKAKGVYFGVPFNDTQRCSIPLLKTMEKQRYCQSIVPLLKGIRLK